MPVRNDGDQDVYAVMGGAHSGDVYQNALFENSGVSAHRWITLRFRGTLANRMAHGGRVRIVVQDRAGGQREIHRVVGTGGSFGSSSLQLELGLGPAQAITALDVTWPGSGPRSHFDEVPFDRVLEVREGDAELRLVDRPRFRLPQAEAVAGHPDRKQLQ